MKVLVFSPHPDDDVIGCGGSIVKHTRKGNEVTVVYLTNGDAGDLTHSKEELAEIRRKEAQSAAQVMGVKETIFLDVHDGYLEYDQEILKKLITIIREQKPDIAYLPHKSDGHRDHTNTFVLVNEAIKRAGRNGYQECGNTPWELKTVLSYEVWTPIQRVNYIEDISEYIEIKLEALRKHESQLASLKYDEAVKGLNRYRGITTKNIEYAECFKVMKIDKI